MLHNRNSFYDGKQRYKVVKNWHEEGETVLAEGFTSQKQATEFYRQYRAEHGKHSTKGFTTVAYK